MIEKMASDMAWWAIEHFRDDNKTVQEIAEIAEDCVSEEVFGKTFSEEDAKKAGDLAFEFVFSRHPNW